MTEQEAYAVLQEATGIKPGDKVKVLRKAEDFELGWTTYWDPKMNAAVGNIYEVYVMGKYGIKLKFLNNCYWFPWFVLKVIERAPDKPVNKFEGIETYELADELAKRLNK